MALTKTQVKALLKKAHVAGMKAGNESVPTPMVVGTPTTLFGNDIDYTKKTYYVPSGVCGFAWININPGNSRLANVAKAMGIARPAYRGGVDVWVSEFGQSMERKEAYAGAFAATLRDAGFNKVYAQSRMD